MTHNLDASHDMQRVSSIELFFDLVFTYTITQLTTLIEHAHGPFNFISAFLILAMIWWMYDAFAWLTTATGTPRHMNFVLFAGMAGFMVIAMSIPEVFGANGLAFGSAYLFVVLLHLGAFVFTGAHPSLRAIAGIAPYNLGAAALAIAAGLVHTSWNWIFFAVAVALFVISTILRRESQFSINPAHFAERHGLVIIIVLGESVVAIGNGAAHGAIDFRTLSVILLSLALISALWWSYFVGESEHSEEILVAASQEGRARIAVLGYWYAHFIMIAGIVLIAAGIKHVMALDADPSYMPWLLAGGLSIYLLGDVLFRRILGSQPVKARTVAAVLAIPLGFVGLACGGVAELTGVASLAIVLLICERLLEKKQNEFN